MAYLPDNQGDFVIPPLGARVYVPREKRPYRVRARNDRFAVCTKPFNCHRSGPTVQYFILDAELGHRGPENLIFGLGAETDGQCLDMLDRVTSGASEVSHRHGVLWDVVRVETAANRTPDTHSPQSSTHGREDNG